MKKKIKFVLFALFGILILAIPLMLIIKATNKDEILYSIETVETGTIENTSVATGKVSPRDEILIKPQISGIITEILKEAGTFVKKGDVIAVVKIIPDVAQLSSAESRIRLARINLNLIEAEYKRQKELFEKGAIAKSEMEKSESDLRNSREELSTASDNLEIIKTGTSKSTRQYSNTQIRATIDGMILNIPVKVGNSVIQANTFNDGTTIASIANMNDMIFIGDLDETEVGRVEANMPMKLSIGAIEKQKFEATLEYISPKGSEKNGAVLFEIKGAARIPSNVYIRAGYSANAEIIVAKAENVLVIPESCIEFSNDSAFVQVLKNEKPKQEFEKQLITVGLSDGVKIEVKSGLNKGDRIRGTEIDPNASKEEKKEDTNQRRAKR